jgi:hypothetical protein
VRVSFRTSPSGFAVLAMARFLHEHRLPPLTAKPKYGSATCDGDRRAQKMRSAGMFDVQQGIATMDEAVRWTKEWLGVDRGDDYSPCSTSSPMRHEAADQHRPAMSLDAIRTRRVCISLPLIRRTCSMTG